MIGILLITHGDLGQALIGSVAHILNRRPDRVGFISVRATDDPINLLPGARETLRQLDDGSGVLVFTDIYGASPSNLAGKLLEAGRVEGIAGVSVPMLVRALTYREQGIQTMVRKAISGGRDGALHINADICHARQIATGTDRRTINRGNHRHVQALKCDRNALNAVAITLANAVAVAGGDTGAILHVLDVATRAKR